MPEHDAVIAERAHVSKDHEPVVRLLAASVWKHARVVGDFAPAAQAHPSWWGITTPWSRNTRP
ncbi:Hypothetical protein A7982_09515 [Minicystis rosea]|nr:Hypothetical protein A7982_09515 [Minicystis rosea]